MTVQTLKEMLSLTEFHLAEPEREVSGGYAGDLLSWVMGRAAAGSAWLTIMSNQNVAAVALMADAACVVLTEGVQPDPDLLRRAREKGVNLLGTALPTYAAACALGGGDGDARPAQGLDVPLDGPAGHFELFRQLRGGDILPLEQDG